MGHRAHNSVTLEGLNTKQFARYSFAGATLGALGALAAGTVDWFAPAIAPGTTINMLFVLYGVLGLLTFVLYRGLSPAVEIGDGSPPAPLGPEQASSENPALSEPWRWRRCSRLLLS